MNLSAGIRAIALALFGLTAISANAQDNAAAGVADSQAVANRIAEEVAQIRGLPFKQPVGVETQSIEQFNEYLARRLDLAVPENIRRHYGKIVRTLGLYRGPEIDDFAAMMTRVMGSQVGAYYDPEKQRFYMLMTKLPELMQGTLYSHELYHALQDQYFELDKYLEMDVAHAGRSQNGDSLLARQAVIEGEATYIMNLWMLQKMTKSIPPREMLAKIVGMQANLSMEQMAEMMKQPQVAQYMGEEMQEAMKSAGNIPPFILDTMMGAYLKGMNFVFAVHEQGWPAVEKLYTEYPPQSTEHILHPEKWLARETAVTFEWPDFGKVAALRDWELLDSNVLGEFQWRIVLREHGLTSEAESVAAGWGGDRYAVFKRKDSDATLLLLRTSWDSEAEAKEFASAYQRVLKTKYADAPTATRVVHKGSDVFVVEGGDEKSIDSLMQVVRTAKKK